MKKLSLFLAVILLVTGCAKKEALVPVRVHVNDFSISQEDFPSKTAVSDYNGVKAITLAFYKEDGAQQCCYTQLRADESSYITFGDFECSLPMGSYTMVVLGYGLKEGEPAITLNSLTEATFGSYPVRETFVATQTVNVNNTQPLTLNAELNRVVARVNVKSTDGRPETVETLRVTFSGGGKGLNPLTGLATSNSGFFNTLQPTVAVGTPTNMINYLFLNTDEQTMNLTIEALNYDGDVVFQKEVDNVPMKRNRITVLSGQMYTAGSSSAFTINTDYIADTAFVMF